MEKIEGSSERLRHLYKEVRAIIQAAPVKCKFSEEEWVAAYIFYLDRNKLKPMLYEINKIDGQIISLADSLDVSGDIFFNKEDLKEICKL